MKVHDKQNTTTDRVWQHSVRVYYEDTDAGGVVYYANYLKFAERARSALLREAGMAVSRMATTRNILFVVQHCCCRYARAARLDDLLSVETLCSSARGARLELEQKILLEEAGTLEDRTLVAELRVTLALVDAQTHKPCRMPSDVAALFGSNG